MTSNADPYPALPGPSTGDQTPRRPPRHRRAPTGALVATVLGLALAPASCGDDASGDASGDGLAERQAEVAERGEDVMPFDLDATTHRFEPTGDGLVETVVADDPDDPEQVGLIQGHLADEAGRFTRGDYSDPAAIHGEDMPGLADLANGATDIDVVYTPLAAGARVTFTTADPDLVDALHAWGEAQVSDHGSHAEHG